MHGGTGGGIGGAVGDGPKDPWEVIILLNFVIHCSQKYFKIAIVKRLEFCCLC